MRGTKILMEAFSNEKICNCNIPANLQKDMMTESIAAYVASLPKEDVVEDSEYEKDLIYAASVPIW